LRNPLPSRSAVDGYRFAPPILRANLSIGRAGAMCGESLFRKRIKPAGARIPFNGTVEPLRVEVLEPRAKPRQLARGKLFDGLLDVLGGSHASDIALERLTEKGAEHGACEDRKMGWVEPLRNPSRDELPSMGLASAFAR
jgi:hypothetical protein